MFQHLSLRRQRVLLAGLALILGLGLATIGLAQALLSNGDSLDPPLYFPGVAGSDASGAFGAGMMPDDNPSQMALSPEAPQLTFSYYFVTGTTMNPRDTTTMNKAYQGLGCASVHPENTALVAEVHLPQGSVIKYLRLYYYDTHNPGYMTAYLTRYEPSAPSFDLVAVSSPDTGTPGDGFVVSNEITHTVQNANYAYVLTARPNRDTTSLRVCGMRVAYYAPVVSFSFLPVVTR